MLKKDLELELNRTKLILDYAREELQQKDKELERLNNIINEIEKSWEEEITSLNNFIQEDSSMIEINNIRKMLIQEREKDLYKLKELRK